MPELTDDDQATPVSSAVAAALHDECPCRTNREPCSNLGLTSSQRRRWPQSVPAGMPRLSPMCRRGYVNRGTGRFVTSLERDLQRST